MTDFLALEGFRLAPSPIVCYLGMWFILSWRDLRPCGLKRNFCFSINQTEGPKLGAFPRIKVINRDKFYFSDPSAKQGKHLITKHLLFLLSCEVHSFLLNSQTFIAFCLVQNDIYSLFCLSLKFPCLCGFPEHLRWYKYIKLTIVFYLNLCLNIIWKPRPPLSIRKDM